MPTISANTGIPSRSRWDGSFPSRIHGGNFSLAGTWHESDKELPPCWDPAKKKSPHRILVGINISSIPDKNLSLPGRNSCLSCNIYKKTFIVVITNPTGPES